MKKFFLILILVSMVSVLCKAQFSLGLSAAISGVGYCNSNESSSSPFAGVQINPSYTFKSQWGVGGNLAWSRLAARDLLAYRNADLFISAYYSFHPSPLTFRLGVGPSARLRYCKVDGDFLSLITTIKIGAGFEPYISYKVSKRISVSLSSLLEAYFYDPLAGYYTQGLNRRFTWACNIAPGISFLL